MIEAEAIVKALGVLAATGWGASLFGWFLYGTVRPRLLRRVRQVRKHRAELKEARGLILVGSHKIRALENTCIAFEKELKRVDRIREKAEDNLRERRRWEDRRAA